MNMTPIIDIVFLLMIFFLLASHFIEAENFEVAVPDNCAFAEETAQQTNQITTLTILKTDFGDEFAVGSRKIAYDNPSELIEQMSRLIDESLENVPEKQRVVVLRIDRQVEYNHAQFALAAVAASKANEIRLATLTQQWNDTASLAE